MPRKRTMGDVIRKEGQPDLVRKCYKCGEPGRCRPDDGSVVLCDDCYGTFMREDDLGKTIAAALSEPRGPSFAEKFGGSAGQLPKPLSKAEAKAMRDKVNVKFEEIAEREAGQPKPDPTLSTAVGGCGTASPSSSKPPSLSAMLAERRAKAAQAGAAEHIEVPALAGTGKTTSAVEGMKECRGIKPSIVPSPQQAAIWDAMKQSKDARTICFTAYSNAIAGELKRRMAESGLDRRGCEAATTHGMGNKAVLRAFPHLRGRDPNSGRTDELLAEAEGCDVWTLRKSKPALVAAVRQLTSLCKQTLTKPTAEGLAGLIDRYDVEVEGIADEVGQLVPVMLERSLDVAASGCIDFDDMVWLPLALDLPMHRHDFLIIDEAQDLNRSRQELVLRAGSRVMFVGDRFQAIFGFTGSDTDSMDTLRASLLSRGGCRSLPLTVTRRCGKAIVREAQRFVPEFEAHPSNPAGSVSSAVFSVKTRWEDGQRRSRMVPWEQTYGPLVKPGDFVLCRCNAPLVSEVFRFISRGIKATILGRKIGEGLVQLIDKVVKRCSKVKGANVADLVGLLAEWQDEERAKERAKKHPSESKVQGIEDRAGCLLSFCRDARTLDDVRAKVRSVFADKACPKCKRAYDGQEQECSSPACAGAKLVLPPGVRFASIHKAKGLESKRVFWLQPEGVGPRRDKMQAWELEQEDHLEYVAITRAIEELHHVK